MEILSEREDITLDTVDTSGRTALSWAAEFGNVDAVKILLKREDVTPNTADKSGRTPLWWAVERGHTRVVKVLLDRCSPSRKILMADLTNLTASPRTSRGVVKRPFRDQCSVPQLAGGTTSNGLFLAEPSESSSALPKRPGDLDINDKSSSPDEPSHFQYHTDALLNLALNWPLLALILSLLFLLLLHILAIYLRIFADHIIAFFHP